jgi:hypothetical protein
MIKKDELELLLKWFNDNLIKASSFKNYTEKKGTLGGSAKNNIREQFRSDRVKVKKALKEAEKILRAKINVDSLDKI